MKIELSKSDIATLLKAIRDRVLDTDDIAALREHKPDEFKGFNFLPWCPAGGELSDPSRYQHGQDNAHLHGYIDDGMGGYVYVGKDEAMKHEPFK